jgi:hypothetical protein
MFAQRKNNELLKNNVEMEGPTVVLQSFEHNFFNAGHSSSTSNSKPIFKQKPFKCNVSENFYFPSEALKVSKLEIDLNHFKDVIQNLKTKFTIFQFEDAISKHKIRPFLNGPIGQDELTYKYLYTMMERQINLNGYAVKITEYILNPFIPAPYRGYEKIEILDLNHDSELDLLEKEMGTLPKRKYRHGVPCRLPYWNIQSYGKKLNYCFNMYRLFLCP